MTVSFHEFPCLPSSIVCGIFRWCISFSDDYYLLLVVEKEGVCPFDAFTRVVSSSTLSVPSPTDANAVKEETIMGFGYRRSC